jgi:hypothetical protein
MPWNLMLGEGLLDYGYLAEAAELVTRLMNTCVASLRRDQAFRESYHPDREQGAGSRHHLAGVAPFSLFLQVLGVRLISPSKITLRGSSPFPEAIRLRWRGLEIRWDHRGAVVEFPDGEQVSVQGEAVQVVEQARLAR